MIILCAACLNEMTEKEKIPDGILFTCLNCGTKRIYINNYQKLRNQLGYGDAYRHNLDKNKTENLRYLFKTVCPEFKPNFELLDIGFGNGDFMKAAAKMGLLSSGLECDTNSVLEISDTEMTAYYGELGGDLSINKEFDIITMWDVIEHIPEIEIALSQINKLIKTGGRIIILTPDANSYLDKIARLENILSFGKSQKIISICLNRYHLHRFSSKGLTILLKRFGFKIAHIDTVQLFSLKSDVYADGFAPGVQTWTKNSFLNRLISKDAMSLLKILKIKNKIFLSAVKT